MKANPTSLDEEDDKGYANALERRKRGIRFFTGVAREHSILVASLVFWVVIHTRRQRDKNNSKAGRGASINRKARDLARILASSKGRVLVALRQAQAAKILDYERRRRGLELWVHPEADYLYVEAAKHREERTWLRYDPWIARLLGINASIIYLFIKYHRSTYRTPESLSRVLTHLSPNAIYCNLQRLVKRGILLRRYRSLTGKKVEIIDAFGDWDFVPLSSDADDDFWGTKDSKPRSGELLFEDKQGLHKPDLPRYFPRPKAGQRAKNRSSQSDHSKSQTEHSDSQSGHSQSQSEHSILTISGTGSENRIQEPERIPPRPSDAGGTRLRRSVADAPGEKEKTDSHEEKERPQSEDKDIGATNLQKAGSRINKVNSGQADRDSPVQSKHGSGNQTVSSNEHMEDTQGLADRQQHSSSIPEDSKVEDKGFSLRGRRFFPEPVGHTSNHGMCAEGANSKEIVYGDHNSSTNLESPAKRSKRQQPIFKGQNLAKGAPKDLAQASVLPGGRNGKREQNCGCSALEPQGQQGCGKANSASRGGGSRTRRDYDSLRIPKNAPVSCYGLELDLATSECRLCPHQDGCRTHMGSRLERITLDKIRWDMVPKEMVPPDVLENPEIEELEACFRDCFQLVFHREPGRTNTARRYGEKIFEAVKTLGFSFRLFILSNMVAWKATNDLRRKIASDTGSKTPEFLAVNLTKSAAVTHAIIYAETCRDKFGTFDATRLGLIANVANLSENGIEERMLASEVTAAEHIISYKLNYRGSPAKNLYQEIESSLDPHWLAIEPSYNKVILEKYAREPFGSGGQKSHREKVVRALKQMKTRPKEAWYAIMVRQSIMRPAVARVLMHFGYDADDFSAPMNPVSDPLMFWSHLGQAILHYNCWLHICGEWDTIFREHGMFPAKSEPQ